MGKERLEFFDFDADLRLSNRTTQFIPVKYLVLIAEKYTELKEQFELALYVTTICCILIMSYLCKFVNRDRSVVIGLVRP